MVEEKVSIIEIEKIKPNPNNPRKHSQKQIEELANMIKIYGVRPILISEDYVIVCGHGRYFASKQAGLSEIPAIIADGWSKEKIDSYIIADNAIADKSFFDFSAIDFSGINIEDFPIGIDFYENENKTIKKKEIKAFELVHFLVSVSIDDWEKIKKIKHFFDSEGIEYAEGKN